eukprot:7365682-Ditylum_brightwellii.AAC.1
MKASSVENLISLSTTTMNIKTTDTLPAKSQRSQRNSKLKKRFKPQPFVNVLLCPFGNQIIIHPENKLKDILGHVNALGKKSFPISTNFHTIKYKGKKYQTKWCQISLNTYNAITKNTIMYNVKDSEALMPLDMKSHILKGEVYFSSHNDAKEYVILNYLLCYHPEVFLGLYDAGCGIQTLTMTHHGGKLDDKYSLVAHYVLCSLDADNLVLYACNENGEGSHQNQFWKAMSYQPMNTKKLNKRHKLMHNT